MQTVVKDCEFYGQCTVSGTLGGAEADITIGAIQCSTCSTQDRQGREEVPEILKGEVESTCHALNLLSARRY